MERNPEKYISLLVERYPKLAACSRSMYEAYEAMKECYEYSRKLLNSGLKIIQK